MENDCPKGRNNCLPLHAAPEHEGDAGHVKRYTSERKKWRGTWFARLYAPALPQELHPILVNFTAALLPLALLSDLLGLWLKRSSLHSAAAWMVLYTAIITPLTGAAGWWWKSKSVGTLPPELIAVHEWLGTSLALIFIVLAIWRWRIHKQNAVPTLAYLVFAVVAVLALVYQGSLGGAMVFGR